MSVSYTTPTGEETDGWTFFLFLVIAVVVILGISAVFWYFKARIMTRAARSSGAGQHTVTIQQAP